MLPLLFRPMARIARIAATLPVLVGCALVGTAPAELAIPTAERVQSAAPVDQFPTTERIVVVRLNRDVLKGVRTERSEDLTLTFPAGAAGAMRTLRMRLRENSLPVLEGQRNWSGEVAGEPDSVVTFAEVDGVIAGSVWMLGETLKVHALADGLYSIERVVSSAYRNEAPPVLNDEAEVGPSPHSIQSCESDSAEKVARVLVLFTDAAAAKAGGEATLRSVVSNMMGEANQVLSNSRVPLRFVIANIEKSSVARSAKSSTYLSNLSADTAIKKRRETLRAHLVSYLDDLPSSYEWAGVGYIMGSSTNPAKSVGYSIADWSSARDNYTMLHEIGHNHGAGHDAAGSTRLFSYSRGMKWANRFRSIMSYRCDGAACDRIPRFTNPSLTFSGTKIGDVETGNNSRTLRQTRCFVAGWFN
jgi:hypothetical protein